MARVAKGMVGMWVAVGVAGVFFLLAYTPPPPRSNTGTPIMRPPAVSEVPATIPGGSVFVNSQVLLQYPGFMPTLSKTEAMAAARTYVHRQPVSAVLASLTVPGSLPISHSPVPSHPIADVPVWVVTFTEPPTNVAVGGYTINSVKTPILLMSHWNVAINAENGRFVVGFFTK